MLSMDDHIAKPVRLTSLEKVFKEWMSDKLVTKMVNISDETAKNSLNDDMATHLDLDAYNELVSKIGERMYVIIDKFIINAGLLLNDIDTSIAANDYENIALKAHTLKGSSLSVAAVRLSNIAKKLEQKAKGVPGEDYRTVVNEAKEEYQAVKACFKELSEKKIA